MGQHKRNPTAIAAKNGEIKPKEKPDYSVNRKAMRDAVDAELRKLNAPFYAFMDINQWRYRW